MFLIVHIQMTYEMSGNVGSIDYSPTSQARNVTITLENNELQSCSQWQMERFLRVWCTERTFYAPNLEHVKVILVPSLNNIKNKEGIHRFLQFSRDLCQNTNHESYFQIEVRNDS